jgi:hypothetical protein
MGMMTTKPQPVAKGYKPQRRVYKLDFSETEHAGLEISARGTSVAGLLQLMEIADKVEGLEELDEKADKADIASALRELFAPFAKILVAWNVVDDDDEPVPASLDGLLSQEIDFVGDVLKSYIQAMSQAPPPLPASSPSGGSSQEALTAMAALSSSLESSPEQSFLSGCARRSAPGCCRTRGA